MIVPPSQRKEARETRITRFPFNYIVQAVFVSPHFLTLILTGLSSLIFNPFQTDSRIINQNIEFITSLTLGVGISGVICWIFAFRIREVGETVWKLCHVLLNICHLISVAIFLFFFVIVGVRSDGTISSLAFGVFSSLIVGIMLSMKYDNKP